VYFDFFLLILKFLKKKLKENKLINIYKREFIKKIIYFFFCKKNKKKKRRVFFFFRGIDGRKKISFRILMES
jgi:hypothetical protein